ncbi:MAG: hypothetical protein GY796_36595 [Chloroflexi bacterium]|nr:hypothetical protein [Chloroflexota bacterium]
MEEWQSDTLEDEATLGQPGKVGRVVITAVTLLILISFLGVILLTFYNQFSGRATLSANFPSVAFLDQDELGTYQLYMTDVFNDKAAAQLTQESDDLLEFAVSPMGTAVTYIVQGEDGGTEIKLFDWHGRTAANQRTLLTCPQTMCERLVWHPDGRRLIYERRKNNTPRLWWLDIQTLETVPVQEDKTAVSQNAAVSPDGAWLSYANPQHEEMVLYEFGQGTQTRLANVLGNTAVWHPTIPQFLFSDFDLLVYHGDENETSHQEHSHDFDQAIHLYLGQTNGDSSVLSGEAGNVNDDNAAWSPDGEWIAYGRKPAGTAAGRQLWLMRADGRENRPLTTDTQFYYGPPRWSEDGRYLLFQRVNFQESNPQPGIWLLEVSTGDLLPVTPSGILPTWLP